LHDFGLLANWFGAAVDLLKHNLHHCRLKLGEHPHFGNSFLLFLDKLLGFAVRDLTLKLVLRGPQANHDSLRILILLFLDLALHLLRIKVLKAVGLYLESIVEVSQVVYVVVHNLRSLLFFGERHL
jgi:hypothetical protein